MLLLVCVSLGSEWFIKTMILYDRFPFDQNFQKPQVRNQMEQNFSAINFGILGMQSCIRQGCPNVPEDQNNWKMPILLGHGSSFADLNCVNVSLCGKFLNGIGWLSS